MNVVPFTPMKNRLLIEPIPLDTVTPSGIIIKNDVGLRPDIGRVLEVGEGITEIKKGDKVLFGKYTGSELKFHEVTYLIMKEEEVFAVLLQ